VYVRAECMSGPSVCLVESQGSIPKQDSVTLAVYV
jgi:hypothetical protein